MRGAYLPGGSRVDLVPDLPDPEPGHGQVVVAVRASGICGSDLRAVYREHLGSGPEAYAGVVAGHEPCGEVVAVGPGVVERAVGDRVVVYHISGCGLCEDCRLGYQISCTSALRAAYGWQRDGGHADLLLAQERDLLVLPEPLTFADGACVACGFGTAWEAVRRAGVGGADAVLVTGLGPVGLAAGLLASALGSPLVLGSDPSPGRRAVAERLGAVSAALPADEGTVDAVRERTGGHGAEVAVDCSGSAAGRATAVRGARRRGRVVLVGEGGRLELDASEDLLHRALTVAGSWVTSTSGMRQLLELLVRWDLHPDVVVTSRFELADAATAYATADRRDGGKVVLEPDRSRV